MGFIDNVESFFKTAFNRLKNMGASVAFDALLIPSLIFAMGYVLLRFQPNVPMIPTPNLYQFAVFWLLFIIADALLEPMRTYVFNPLWADLTNV